MFCGGVDFPKPMNEYIMSNKVQVMSPRVRPPAPPLARASHPPQDHLTQSVFEVVWPKSIPAQIRLLILYISNRNGHDPCRKREGERRREGGRGAGREGERKRTSIESRLG